MFFIYELYDILYIFISRFSISKISLSIHYNFVFSIIGFVALISLIL